jgi:hypothetical protein
MEKLVRHIRFPFEFDTQKLQNEVQLILNKNWIKHYNANDYIGNWSSIALVSQGGKSDNINAFPMGKESIDYTDAIDNCHYFKEIIDSFLFEKTTVRLLRLAVGAVIKPHVDNCLGYEDGNFRIHIPVITNKDVEFILDNERLLMNEGECWYINANFTHSVANKGDKDRIHLVIDGIRNEWTDTLFFKEANEKQFMKQKPQISNEEKKLIIKQLELMNTETSIQLIADLISK